MAFVVSWVLPAAAVAVTSDTAPVTSEWVLVHRAYTPDDYTEEPFVGNGYLSQRLPAIGAGYEGGGVLGKSGYPLDNDRYTSALVAGVYAAHGTHAQDFIAALPTWSTLSLKVAGKVLDAHVPVSAISRYAQSLDMHDAIVTTSFTWTPAPGRAIAITYQVLANRRWMHLGQVRIVITPSWSGALAVTGLLDGAGAERITPESRAVDLAANSATVRLVTPGRGTRVVETEVLRAGSDVRRIATARVVPPGDAASAGVRWTLRVRAGHRYVITKYVGIATSNAAGDPVAVAARAVRRALEDGWPRLVAQHTAAWHRLWQANVRVASLPLQQAIDSSLYLLYSSLRKGVDFSIPPAGLSSDNYAGDIYWDADTWMFPALLALHPGLARSIVMFRYDTLHAAEANAAAAGHRGAEWAWNNGPSGTCGGLAPCAHYEIHLQSEIALAQWQYFEATGNRAWLRTHGWPVIRDVAAFWVSRVRKRADGKFHIDNVTGPDEFESGVDDDAATNAGAIVVLHIADAAARVLGIQPDPAWSRIARNIYVAVAPDGTHPEYAGYADQTIKQADVVLMAYPLGYVSNPAVAAANLRRYLRVTDPGGPAMTASVEAIVAARARLPGCLDYSLFRDAYEPFLRGAFDQFNETRYLTPSGGQSYPAFDFATGAGGFLQTFFYGFGGLAWHPDELWLAPILPPQLRGGVTLAGLRYHGRTLSVGIGHRSTRVALLSGQPITVATPAGTERLMRGHPLTIATAQPAAEPPDAARCNGSAARAVSPDLLQRDVPRP